MAHMFAAPVAVLMTQLIVGQPQLELRVDSCADVNVAEVGRIVAVELRVAIVAGGEVLPTTTQVAVGCRGPFYQVRVDEPDTAEVVVDAVVQRGYLEIRVDDPITGKTLQRLVDVESEPDQSRARLIGIAISELTRASWIELLANPAPKVAPVEKVTTPSLQRAVVERARPTLTTSLAPGCGFIMYGRGLDTSMVGCGVATRVGGANWHMSAMADVMAGDHDVALGRVDTTMASAFGGAGGHVGFGPLVLAGDVGWRMAYLTIAGDASPAFPVVGSALRGAWGGPAARFALDAVINRWLALRASVEFGYALLGPRGTALAEDVVDSQGLWLYPGADVVISLP